MEIKLVFFGASRNVTGSCYLVEANGFKFLVDCGLYQERDLKKRNWEPFPIAPETIDAVLLTHAHLDHCGRIPKLVKEGFKGKIYCTEATAEIAEIIMLDSAHIQEEDALFKKKRHEREGRTGPFPEIPLYTKDDARESFPLFEPVSYEDQVSIADGIEVMFHDAGHVLGSAMIEICVHQDGEERTLLFSGDVGRENKPILRDPSVFKKIDYVIVESTYGDREHPVVTDIKESLAQAVNTTWEAGGNIIVPSFALERSQELLYYMNELLIADRIPHIMVFLDSPMAIKITEVFKKYTDLYDEKMTELVNNRKSPFSFPGLKMVQTVDESKAINHIRGTVMVIAGSGMLTGGRIKHHLVTNIGRPESTVLFVGYQAKNTLGRIIVDGAAEVRLLGQQYRVRARIQQILGFSSHADRNELLKWLNELTSAPRKVIIVHGESESAESFGKFLKEQTGWKVEVPYYQSEVILD